MFVNFGFIINGHLDNESQSDLISAEVAQDVFTHIAKHGMEFSTLISGAEDLKLKFRISERVAKLILIQSMELRLVCANWMNCNATIGYDELGNEILNSIPPQNLDELKESALWTCNRDIGAYDPIYNFSTLEEAINNFNFTIDLIISWSKLNGNGDWNYYKTKILQNYNFEELNNQIIQAKLLL